MEMGNKAISENMGAGDRDNENIQWECDGNGEKDGQHIENQKGKCE